jgi:hypothetical protein
MTRGDERTAEAKCAHTGCDRIVMVKPGSAGHPCCDSCFEMCKLQFAHKTRSQRAHERRYG